MRAALPDTGGVSHSGEPTAASSPVGTKAYSYPRTPPSTASQPENRRVSPAARLRFFPISRVSR